MFLNTEESTETPTTDQLLHEILDKLKYLQNSKLSDKDTDLILQSIFDSAQLELALTPDKLIIRKLNHNDIGGIWKISSLDWNTQLTRKHTVPSTEFLVLTGFRFIGEAEYISKVKVYRGGRLMRMQGEIFVNEPMYFLGSVQINQNVPFEIAVEPVGKHNFYVDPLGFVCEPEGKNIYKY